MASDNPRLTALVGKKFKNFADVHAHFNARGVLVRLLHESDSEIAFEVEVSDYKLTDPIKAAKDVMDGEVSAGTLAKAMNERFDKKAVPDVKPNNDPTAGS